MYDAFCAFSLNAKMQRDAEKAQRKQKPAAQVLKLQTSLKGRLESQNFQPEAQAKDDSQKLLRMRFRLLLSRCPSVFLCESLHLCVKNDAICILSPPSYMTGQTLHSASLARCSTPRNCCTRCKSTPSGRSCNNQFASSFASSMRPVW